MSKFKSVIRKMGFVPIVISIIAFIVMAIAAVMYNGPKLPVNGLWSGFVSLFTQSILGIASWFANSYGWAIVIFTILVRLFILPLMIYQIDEMLKMQKIQPKLKEIQAKYKGQKDKESLMLMQNEQRSLYKSEGVNAFASFIPMIVQLPILFALYQSIWNSKTLKTGQFLWFQLGSSDPYYVLPLLAALFTFVSSWLAMKSNPEQNAMTKAMPYIFPVVIFFSALAVPTALSVYWVVTNAFQAVQTWYLQNPFKLAAERRAIAQAKRDKEKAKRKALKNAYKKNKK